MDQKQNIYPSMPQPAYPPQPQSGFQQPPPYNQGAYPHPVTQQPQMVTTTIITAPVMGSGSTRTRCPSCQAEINTRVEHEASTKTHLFAVLLCLLFCPCVCLPYCVDSCKNANHYCPSCGSYIGTYQN